MKYEGLEQVVVVASFGEAPQQVESAFVGTDVVVRHARDAASLESMLGDEAAVDVVLVDRWLLGDAAGRCIALTRRERGIACVLLVSDSASLGTGRSDIGTALAESVDAVLEKPVTPYGLEAAIKKALANAPSVGTSDGSARDASGPDATQLDVMGADADASSLRALGTEDLDEDPADVAEEAIEPIAPASEPAARAVDERRVEGHAGGESAGGVTPRGPVWAAQDDPEHGPGRLLAEVRDTLRRLTEVIQYDSLTGLLHRDFFLERAAHEERSAKRSGLPLSVLMIDVDDFKAVNDRHGHDAGNEALGRIGEAIRATIREDLDLASRLYGDEFAILLPATPVSGAVRLAERLQERLAAMPDAPGISIGCHGLAGRGLAQGVQALMERADQALVEGKRRAKGGITIFGAESSAGASPASERGASRSGESAYDAPADDTEHDDDRGHEDRNDHEGWSDHEDRSDHEEEGDRNTDPADDFGPALAISPIDTAPPPRPEWAEAPGGPADAESEVGEALSGMAADASRVAEALKRLAEEDDDDDDAYRVDAGGDDPLTRIDHEVPRLVAPADEVDADDAFADDPVFPELHIDDADDDDEVTDDEDERAEVDGDEDPLTVALAEAVGALADESDLREATEFRGKALFVSDEPDVAAIVVEFLRGRGMAVDVVPDFAAALTSLDTLEYFAAFADGPPDRADVAAFIAAGRRIDPALFFFLFVPGDGAPRDPGSATPPHDARSITVTKPFLLSELFMRASRAREDYHLTKERVSEGRRSAS